MKWERTGVEIQGNGEKTITYRSPAAARCPC